MPNRSPVPFLISVLVASCFPAGVISIHERAEDPVHLSPYRDPAAGQVPVRADFYLAERIMVPAPRTSRVRPVGITIR
jgi:hypothetical protein